MAASQAETETELRALVVRFRRYDAALRSIAAERRPRSAVEGTPGGRLTAIIELAHDALKPA